MDNITLKFLEPNMAVFSLKNTELTKYTLKGSQDNDTIYILCSAPELEQLNITDGNMKDRIREFIDIKKEPYFVVSETDPEMVLEIHKDLFNHLNDLLKPMSFKINDTNQDEYIPIFYYESENTLEAAIIKIN